MAITRRTLPRRRLTVGYSYYPARRNQGISPAVPYLRLRGRWLHDAGFVVGQPVKVVLRDHCIVITPMDD